MRTARRALLVALYLAGFLLPLALAAAFDPFLAPRPFLLELGVALGFVAFGALALELWLVARSRLASEAFGTDALMLFHRRMGACAGLLVGAHVAACALALGPRASLRALADPAGILGLVAAVAVLVLLASSLARRRLRIPWERWRALHLLATWTLVGAMLAHVLFARGYSRQPLLRWALAGYALLFLGGLARSRLLRPLRLAARPWRVLENRDEGADTRTLVLAPHGHAGFAFRAGQFVWLITGAGPLRGEQHPISIASTAERTPDAPLELTIKALGDWSSTVVPALAAGSRVWLDGPYGAFTADGLDADAFLLVGGGIGITPMRSLLRTLRDRGDRRPVVLVQASADPSRAIWRAELEELCASHPAARLVRVYERPPAGWEGERGLVEAELLARHLPAGATRLHAFVCGPGAMMDALERGLVALGLPPARIHTERFDLL